MRSPSESVKQLPASREAGGLLRELLEAGIRQYPQLLNTASDIINQKPTIRDMDQEALAKVKRAANSLLQAETPLPQKTAPADSPINAELLWGWGEHTDDPDAQLLARWVRQGAPLGFDHNIETVGVFPRTTGTPIDAPEVAEIMRPAEGWENWPSAVEEAEDLERLVKEARAKGFCETVWDAREVSWKLGGPPLLNRLGVVVKMQGDHKKSRIIWDMRESKVNSRCDPAERIILPRLLDVVHDALGVIRSGGNPTFAVVDIQDAFHNVPAGEDRKYTVAAAPIDGELAHIIYNVLVFGSKSSPTIWGRYAAFMGRALSCVIPENKTQIYVDNPIWTVPAEGDEAVKLMTLAILTTLVFGYPLKLSKASAGKKIKWVGAELEVGSDTEGPFVKVRIPEDKISKLLQEVEMFLKAPVVGTRLLRSFAGGMSFVAGLVPVLRPFLAPLWAALSKGAANDGESEAPVRSRTAGKLVHLKRIAPSLHWIRALLPNEHGDLERKFPAELRDEGWEIITDACPWGIGGVLYKGGTPMRWFASELPKEVLEKFTAKKGDPAYNTLWEALALLVGLRLWLPKCPKNLSVRVKSDNVGALRMLLNLASRKELMAVIAREVALDIAAGNYRLTELVHVSGITNVVADALSRLWAPHPASFPNIGTAIKDAVPSLGSGFWKVL